MNRSRHGAGRGARFAGMGVAIVASVLLSMSDANAQTGGDSVAAPSACLKLPGSVLFPGIAKSRSGGRR